MIVSIHWVKNLENVNPATLLDGHIYITPDGAIYRYSLADGEIGGIGSLFKKIGAIALGVTPAVVPLIPGLPQNVQQAISAGAQIASGFLNVQSQPGADFAGAGSQLIAQMDAIIQAIRIGQLPGDRIAVIRQVEQAVYAFQRIAVKKNDKPQFKQVEAAVIAKLNELRTTDAPTGQLTTTGQQTQQLPGTVTTAEGGIDTTNFLLIGVAAIGLIWILKQ
jgi:hypothetical protein